MALLADSSRKAALAIAVAADALQLGLFPLFGEGFLSPLDDVLDFIVAWLLIRLLGWHWIFLPTAIAELVPGIDVVPAWTIAVLYVLKEMAPAPPEGPVIEGKL